MSYILQRLINAARQPLLINNLNTAFRALSVTPSLTKQQQNPKLKPKLTTPAIPAVINDTDVAESDRECQAVFDKVNNQLAAGQEGRLFAVIQLCGKQFKITAGDIILIEGYWPPTIGDEIRLDKVLLAGAQDFTLIGRPMLEPGLVNIKATIIEKTLTHTKTHFKKKRRKQYTRINFQRAPNTMIRINSIEVGRNVDATLDNADELRLF